MKRYVSMDFLRGLAITLMLLLHVFIETFNTDPLIAAVQEGEGQIGLIIFAVFLVYFASFAGLFIALSGFGNCFSMIRQYESLVASNVPNPHKIVCKNQVIRGIILFGLGYFHSVVLWPLLIVPLLELLEQVPVVFSWQEMVDELFWFNIIPFLGIATIILAIIFTQLLKRYQNLQKIKKILWIIVIFLYIASPLILYGIRSIPEFWPRPYANWETRDIGTNIAFFFLIWLAGREQALFPWIIALFIGTIIAIDVHETPINKKFWLKWLLIGITMFLLGLILQIVFAGIADGLEGEAKTHFEGGFGIIFGAQGRSSAYMLFAGGGEVISIASMLFLVEGRGRGKIFAKRTIFIRRMGMVALTIYLLQAFTLFPINLMEHALGLEFWEQQETPLQSLLIMGVCIILWMLIVFIWEKLKFVGTFEWIAVKLVSKQRKGATNRLDPNEILYNVEPADQNPTNPMH